jgi:hypothetical protein
MVSAEREKPTFLEYRQRVVYSLFRAVARVGVRLRMPIDEVSALLQMAYFEEAREAQRLDLAGIADLFGKSLRTISSLHNKYRKGFFAPERDVEFRRAIAAEVNRGSKTLDELEQIFSRRTRADLEIALADLVREKRILKVGEKYRRNPEDHIFFNEADIVARVDGMNRQQDIIAETVFKRLLDPESANGDPVAARSFVFKAKPEELKAALDELLKQVLNTAIELDENAAEAGAQSEHGLTIAVAPMGNSEDPQPDPSKAEKKP